jgi:hypothetical protein
MKHSYRLAKEKVFYSTNNDSIDIQAATIFLHEQCLANNWDYGRICFHQGECCNLMSMLIVMLNKYVYPAHRHDWKDETYVVASGKAIYQEFSNSVEDVLFECELVPGSIFINNRKNFHRIVPETKIFAFIEHTVGPFTNKQLEYLHSN